MFRVRKENELVSRGKKNEKKITEPLNGSKSRDKVNTGKVATAEHSRKRAQTEARPACNPIIPGRQAGCNCSLVPVSTLRPVTAGKPQSAGKMRNR